MDSLGISRPPTHGRPSSIMVGKPCLNRETLELYIHQKVREYASELLRPTEAVSQAVTAQAAASYECIVRLANELGRLQAPVRSRINSLLQRRADALALAVERFLLHAPELGVYEGDEPDVTGFELTGGESHNGGQVPLFFRRATGQDIFYKPVSLACERLYDRLLACLQQADKRLDCLPRTYCICTGSDYGFLEVLRPSNLTGNSLVAPDQFYWMAGCLAAIAHAFRITDLHMENVLALPLGPVLIDLESAFYRHRRRARGWDITHTGMIQDGTRPRLYSGLQGGGNYYTLSPHLKAFAGRTDVCFRKPIEVVQNRLFSDGHIVSPEAHCRSLLAGFRSAYNTIMETRWDLLDTIAEFLSENEVRVRYIARPTILYVGILLRQLYNGTNRPADLTDQLSREDGIDGSLPTRIIRCEVEDLLSGDVPYFWGRAGNKELYHHSGMVFPDFFSETAMDAVTRSLASLGPEDQEHQIALISRCFDSM